MATASAVVVSDGSNDDPQREELETPPAAFKSKVWNYFGFPVSYVEKNASLTQRQQFVVYARKECLIPP